MNPEVATGQSYGSRSAAAHAERAVRQALEKAKIPQAHSVLLFLTSDCAGDAGRALVAAARAAGCTQVIGASGVGVLTEEDWVLDSSGAAAMVFGADFGLAPPGDDPGLTLTLSTPASLSSRWLDEPVRRLGAISSDDVGQGPFIVWSGSRVLDGGMAEAELYGVRSGVALAQGVRALTAPLEVVEVQGYDIRRLGNYPALNVLINSLPSQVRNMEQIPLHMLMCGITFGEPEHAIRQGRFRLDHIVAANPEDYSVTLTHELHPGEKLFWALRDKLAAEREFYRAVDEAAAVLDTGPDFGLLFPCLGRGPALYGNRDLDIEILRARYPGMPFAGFYGNGEIAPLDEGSYLYQYSAAVGLFARDRNG